METAISPPSRTSSTFMRMEVILPAMLFKKFGAPLKTIFLIIAQLKRGFWKRSSILPRKKGT